MPIPPVSQTRHSEFQRLSEIIHAICPSTKYSGFPALETKKTPMFHSALHKSVDVNTVHMPHNESYGESPPFIHLWENFLLALNLFKGTGSIPVSYKAQHLCYIIKRPIHIRLSLLQQLG